MKTIVFALAGLSFVVSLQAEDQLVGTQGHYGVLSGGTLPTPPVAVVDVLVATPGGSGVWWQLEARAKDDAASEPLFLIQALTSRSPMAQSDQPLNFDRYILRIPTTGETLEYRNVHTSKAILPPWREVVARFFPRPVEGSGFKEGLAETCTCLGHILLLQEVKTTVPFKPLENVKVLDLDPELLIGTSRNFKDTEGHRIPQTPERKNYTYTPFVEADYKIMIEAGINLFTIAPDQEAFVRSQPVFYLRGPEEKPPMRLPADLYRSNYTGTDMFLDEPASLMWGEPAQLQYRRRPLDAVAALRSRVHQQAHSVDYGPFSLERRLRQQGYNLGDLRIEQYDMPIWETVYETTFYQMAGGTNGLVHEGRYQLDWFDKTVADVAGVQRKHTVDEMLRYYYAFLRGGTRPFGKYWGTAIYGQCDPAIAPRAMTLAYDMGARYLWFWTSDHEHHMPWPEQLELTRTLRKHAKEHPRPSIAGPPPMRDLAIAIPYGTFLSIEDPFGPRDEQAVGPYHRLVHKLHQAINEGYDRKEDFDITVDDGREITGYRRIVRLGKAE